MPTISFKAAALAGFACCWAAVSWTAASWAADEGTSAAPPSQQPSTERAPSHPKKAKQPAKAKPAPIADSREMLELFGVEPSYLAALVDGRPIGPDEEEALWRVLFAVRRFAPGDIYRWTKPPATLEQAIEAPDEARGEIIELAGRVRKLAIEKPLAEVVDRFNLPRFYRCELEIGDDRRPVTVYSLAVPKAWKAGQPLDERCSVRGFFLKLGKDNPQGRPEPIFAAQRVAWHPETELGDLKMDVGLFDELSPKPETAAEDRECFYELLAAAGRAGTQELFRRTPQVSPVAPLFNQPKSQQGKLVALLGTARQAHYVKVEDPDIVSRFGIDHFYEIEISTPDSQNNPITFCVRQLPEGFPQGDRILETVRIPGFFMKKWGYRVDAPLPQIAGQPDRDADGELVRRQLAPLLIGREPLWIPTEQPDTGWATTTFVAIFVAGILVLWLIVWRLNRSDDRFHRQVVRKATETDDRSLNDLGLEDIGPPRFD